MKICLNPKTRGKTLPWQMPLVMMPLMEAQTIVQDHGYDTAEKLSRLKPDNINILIKTFALQVESVQMEPENQA